MDKLAVALISPLGIALVLGTMAVLLGLVGGRRRAGRSARPPSGRWSVVLGAIAVLVLALGSMPVVSHALRGHIESKFPPTPIRDLPTAQAIVVLGGGIRPPEPGAAAPDLGAGADRVWFGARLYHAGKAPLVVLSGGSDPRSSATSEADASVPLIRDLGVPAQALLLERDSRDTLQNARFTAPLLRERGIRRILLVTSALHMPRAMAKFQAEGFEVLPAATDHEAQRHHTPSDWLPTAIALDGTARAIKELVGIWFPNR
jgi:uncharacterized SAM-binding protein YcdF (DUF218 family)